MIECPSYHREAEEDCEYCSHCGSELRQASGTGHMVRASSLLDQPDSKLTRFFLPAGIGLLLLQAFENLCASLPIIRLPGDLKAYFAEAADPILKSPGLSMIQVDKITDAVFARIDKAANSVGYRLFSVFVVISLCLSALTIVLACFALRNMRRKKESGLVLSLVSSGLAACTSLAYFVVMLAVRARIDRSLHNVINLTNDMTNKLLEMFSFLFENDVTYSLPHLSFVPALIVRYPLSSLLLFLAFGWMTVVCAMKLIHRKKKAKSDRK